MESIVGGIPSSGQAPEGPVVRREDGSWLLDGMLPVDELHDIIGMDTLPGEGQGYYRTLGGFVMMYLERTPKTGDVFTWNNFLFEVVDMDGYRVDKVLITPVLAGEEKSG